MYLSFSVEVDHAAARVVTDRQIHTHRPTTITLAVHKHLLRVNEDILASVLLCT